MGVGYYEAILTPRAIISSDLEMMEMEEATMIRARIQQQNG